MDVLRHCAYNETSGRLIGADVAAADFCDASLAERMAELSPRSGAGLWMIPFRGIPTDDLRKPLDLVYLDERFNVIDAVESFPQRQVSATARPAASVLALPEEAIALSRTQPGDQLLVCTLDELKEHLRQKAYAVEAPLASPPAEAAPLAAAAPVRETEIAEPEPAVETQAPAAKSPEPAKPPIWATKEKTFFQKLFKLEPRDPRRAPRALVDGLLAYYWDGATPIPRTVRDISSSGLYIITQERWYPGTLVRLSLTKADSRGVKHSLAVQARAIRWGNDGVGMEFVLTDLPDQNRSDRTSPDGANREQFEDFMRKIKR